MTDQANQFSPEITALLLIDRTTSTAKTTKNIIWATTNYQRLGKYMTATDPISTQLLVDNPTFIVPRAFKHKIAQKSRTKDKAEVFTPTWIVKLQNDAVDADYANDDLITYTNRTWLEITAGEGPYMTSQYEMDSGEPIVIPDRVGFVDRKLARINQEVDNLSDWQDLVKQAYQASYGFEWSGDSLYLARKNLLTTYQDVYYDKWQMPPTEAQLQDIATIISYNVFQMDGLKYIIPLSQQKVRKPMIMDLFDPNAGAEEWETTAGKRVKVMNWTTGKMEFFDKGIRK